MPPRIIPKEYGYIGAAGKNLAGAVGGLEGYIKEQKQARMSKEDWDRIGVDYKAMRNQLKTRTDPLVQSGGMSAEEQNSIISRLPAPLESAYKNDHEGYAKTLVNSFMKTNMQLDDRLKSVEQQQQVSAAGQQILTEQPELPPTEAWEEEVEGYAKETPRLTATPGRPAATTQEQFMGTAATEFPQVPAEQLQEGAAFQSLPTQKDKSQEERYAKAEETAKIKAETAGVDALVKKRRQEVRDKLSRDRFYFEKEIKIDKQKIATAKEVREIDKLIYNYGIDRQGMEEDVVRTEDEYHDLKSELKEAKESGVKPEELEKIYSEISKKGKEVEGYKDRANNIIPKLIEKLAKQRKEALTTSGGGSYTGGGAGRGSQEQTNPYSPQVLSLGGRLRKKGYSEDKIKEAMDKLRGMGK